MKAQILLAPAAVAGVILATLRWWPGNGSRPSPDETTPPGELSHRTLAGPASSASGPGTAPLPSAPDPAAAAVPPVARPEVTRLPPELQEFLETPELQAYLKKGRPLLRVEAIPRVGEPLLSELLARLESTPDPGLASRLSLVLASTPEQRVVEAIIRKLTNGFTGQDLPVNQIFEVSSLASRLGWLARENDSALAFLKQGTTLSFWGKHRRWRVPPTNEELANRAMAGGCWSGLGSSGRPEALEFLLEHRDGKRSLESTALVGEVVDAAFWWYEAQVGFPGHGSLRKTWDRFTTWLEQTEEGRKWKKWSRQGPQFIEENRVESVPD